MLTDEEIEAGASDVPVDASRTNRQQRSPRLATGNVELSALLVQSRAWGADCSKRTGGRPRRYLR